MVGLLWARGITQVEALAELTRVKRVADQSSSAHARLRDRYATLATALDTVVLCASAWVTALALVDPAFAPRLAPAGMPPTLWIGLLSIAAFIATLVQLKLDLKGKSDAHQRAFEAQSEIKHAANDALQHAGDADRLAAVYGKVALAAAVGVSIPEKEFLPQKAIHLRKVEMSRLLDNRPFASLLLVRLRLWWRDNFDKSTDPNNKD